MEKIYFLRLKSGKHGGAENYLKRLQDELCKRGIEFENINSKLPSFFPSFLKAISFCFFSCRNKKQKFYFSLERITCPDVYRAGDGVHKEFLKTKSKSLNPLNFVYLFIEKRLFKNAKLIIANSNFIKNQIISNYKTNPEKIKVIYNGIKHKKLDYQKVLDLKKSLKLENAKTILFVGSGYERKGVANFLQILSKLTTKYNAIIIGKDKNIQKYKNIAKNLSLNVTFLGKRDDVDLFYELSDIFLFPTKYEPFSNVILEAMSFNCIPFTTLQNGASEILPQEQIINENIAKTLDDLIQNDTKLKTKKQENYDISLKFSIEKNTTLTLEALELVR